MLQERLPTVRIWCSKSDKHCQTDCNELLDDFVMKKARAKPFHLFAGLCSALLDSTIVAFCTYFVNDGITEILASPVATSVCPQAQWRT